MDEMQPDYDLAPYSPDAPPPEGLPVEDMPPRSQARRFVGLLVIAAATSQILGYTIKTPSLFEANDISRWCTVWSLVERGTYAIDDAPWQGRTQDKVFRSKHLEPPGPDASPLKRFEYWLAPASWKEGEPEEHYYSSKPPLLPTIIAGMLYPFRQATGVPIEKVYEEQRYPRNVQVEVEGQPGKFEFKTLTAEERGTVKWPVYVYYFKPVLVVLNILPHLLMLVLFARLLDRHAANDWAWFFSLVAAAWGTYLFAFDQTLNNHTVAAYSAFFATYAMIRVVSDGRNYWIYYALAGFFGGFTACNELPAALFGVLLFLILGVRSPKRTVLAFIPAAAVPILAFLITQFLAFGQFVPVYEEFGTKSYEYEGSYWNTPLEMDYFNVEPEPKEIYLLHMTLGHHGVWSLTPLFLFSVVGILANLFGSRRRLSTTAWLTLILTAAMVAFYTWNPKARNYGGSTQGLRWLFWLIPFWLMMLPLGVRWGQNSKAVRWLCVLALCISVFSVGFAMRMPWSHPWILDALERAGLYDLRH